MTPERSLIHPRDEILHAMQRIYRYRMTTTSGGNLSIRDDNGDIWITPARVDKGSLRREDIIRVRPDGSTEGLHPPSSELPFHRAIYEARLDVRGIVHAHPVALVAFSICGRVPDTRLLPQARQICGTVGFAPYALPGSAALGASIARTFADGHSCVVLENHGVVTAGASLQAAFERFETLEFTAKTIVKASLLGEVRYLSDADAVRSRLRPLPAGPLWTEPVETREKELRRQLCEFVRRSYQQRLMISTEGAFSVRLDADAFLITPHRVDRHALEVHDVVFVRRGVPEAAKRPSGSCPVHAAIYEAHPDIQAVVHAYPVNATAFSVTAAALDTRTIPESYVFLRDVGRAPFGDGQALVRLASLRQPALILDNDGVQICGTSILDAFDRLEVLESTAEALINSRPLGAIVPMSDEVIAGLRQAFNMD